MTADRSIMNMGACGWICWLIGAGAGVMAYWLSSGGAAIAPAMMIALATGTFVALVLGNLACGDAADIAEAVAAVAAEVEADAAEKDIAREIATREVIADAEDAARTETEIRGRKPELLVAPREGGADNLKKIKGIGPKLEGICHRLGIYHFDQIAEWDSKEITWVDAHLEGFRGRVRRDNWVEQARILATGGETEFSARTGGTG